MKIICIGKNYLDHIKELGGTIPEKPIFFLKPDTAILPKRHAFYIPEYSNEIHYETELVIRICKVGKYIETKFAHTYYNEIGLGFDFTARDLQRECVKNGLPWEISKSFDHSAPISTKFIDKNNFADIDNIHFHLNINGKTVQKGFSGDMIFKFDTIISYISKFITLKMGDLIFTGTPAGVGTIKSGDKLEAYLENEKMLSVNVK